MSQDSRIIALAQAIAVDIVSLTEALQAAASSTKTTASTGSELVTSATDILQTENTADTEIVAVGRMGQVVVSGSGDIVDGGHAVGLLGNTAVMPGAGDMPQALGTEGRIDVYPGYTGAIGEIKSQLGLANLLGGSHSLVSLTKSEAAIAAGVSVGEMRGLAIDLQYNLGSIDSLVGLKLPDLSAHGGIGEKYLALGLDPAAPIWNKAPIVDAAYGYSAPASGSTVAIPPMISDFQFIGGATLAALTVVLPAPAEMKDGAVICLGTQVDITALTIDPNGGTLLNATTSMSAGGSVRYKFYGQGLNVWAKR